MIISWLAKPFYEPSGSLEPVLISGFCSVKWMRVIDSAWRRYKLVFILPIPEEWKAESTLAEEKDHTNVQHSAEPVFELAILKLEGRDLTITPITPS